MLIILAKLTDLTLKSIKSNDIVFEINATKPFRVKISSNICVIRTGFCLSLGSCSAPGVGL